MDEQADWAERKEAMIIVNPTAHNFPARERITEIDAWLREQGWYVSWRPTEGRGHAKAIAAEAAGQGYPLVFALGGDGTLSETANGLAGSDTALAPIPGGVSNLWAREIGLGKDPLAAVQSAVAGERRRIDLGQAGEHYFMLMASYGIDAAVTANVSPQLKGRIGAAAYAVSSAREILRFRGTRSLVHLDDEVFEADLLTLIAGNTRKYAGVTQVTPDAVVDDGMLDICAYVGRGRMMIVTHAARTLLQMHRRAGTVVYRRVKRLRVEWARPLPLQIDGDAMPDSPPEVTIVPGALWVTVPKGFKSPLFQQASRPAGRRRPPASRTSPLR